MDNNEYARSLDAWSAEQTAHNFARLLGGQDQFFPKKSFPFQIDPTQIGHIFDDVRQAGENTNQTKEAFSLVGFKTNGELVSNRPITGNKTFIDINTIDSARKKLIKSPNVKPGFLLVHSHPYNDPEIEATLSISDLYFIISMPEKYPGIIAVQGKKNSMAICSSEVKPLSSAHRNQQEFVKHWYSTNGWKHERGKNNEDLSKPLYGARSTNEIVIKIANEYGIVLYKGEAVGPLTRIN